MKQSFVRSHVIRLGAVVAMLALIGAACSSKTTNTNTGPQVIGGITIPAAGISGKYLGKLESLDVKPADFPAVFGKFDVSLASQPATYFTDASITADTPPGEAAPLQSYSGALYTTDSTTAPNTGTISMWEYRDTAGATKKYAPLLAQSQPFANSNNAETAVFAPKKFSSVSLEHFYTVSGSEWKIYVLDSNLYSEITLTLPLNTKVTDVESFMTNWLKKVTAYTAGTQADVQAENAAGH